MSIDTGALTKDLTKGIIRLAQCEKGTGHDQWLTGVIVQMDLMFTNKLWIEAERYNFFNFVSSQSTMHRIANFNLDDAYIKFVDQRIVDIMKEKIGEYKELLKSNDTPQDVLRDKYLEILYSNPSGFKITAGITTNYRQLKTIYAQRKDHRLPEWREFCDWMCNLPESYLITGN